MAIWSALPFLLFNAGGLVVDTASPDSFCPALEQTRQVVASRLGTVELEGTWQATYVSVHRATGEYVALTLRDPTGVVRLEREFPVQEGSCLTLSQVIALVLERYFSRPELPQEVPAPAIPPNPTPGVQTHNGSASTPTERAPASTATNQPPKDNATELVPIKSDTSHDRVTFQTSLGVSATNTWLAPWISVGVGIHRNTSLALGGGFDLRSHEEAIGDSTNGVARARRVPLTLTLSQRILSANQFRLHLGGGLLGVLERGRTTGLAVSRVETRLVPGLAALVTGYFFNESAFLSPFVSAQAALTFEALSPRFEVDGNVVLAPAAITVGGLLGVQLRF